MLKPPLFPRILTLALPTLTLLAPAQQAMAQNSLNDWEAGVVLDAASLSRGLALGTREQGLGLGHSDLVARGPLGAHLSAEISAAFHTEDDKLETHWENVWLQTRTLPQGFQARVGRFASQIGYQNEIHPHADDFTERPLLYRGFLGGHWIDDGVRLNWTAPTPFFLRLGAEAFYGKKLVEDTQPGSKKGVAVLNLKMGDDWSSSQSWQWGLSYLHNRRKAVITGHEHHEDHEDEHEEHGHEHEHEAEHEEVHAGESGHNHSHAAQFSGRHIWMTDFVWKWAPEGNSRNEQVKINAEYAMVSGLAEGVSNARQHHAASLGAVWRFHPSWETGIRFDWLRVNQPERHESHYHFNRGRLREASIMLAWKPTHQQTVRLQFTEQHARGRNGEGEAIFENPANRSVMLQYVIGFGAHGAHTF